MSEFTKVTKLDELSAAGKMLVEVEDRLVVLFHVDGQVYCMDDVCTHDGGPLSDGELDGCQIACPRHGARFDVTTGGALTMPATQDTLCHYVKVDDQFIYVKIKE